MFTEGLTSVECFDFFLENRNASVCVCLCVCALAFPCMVCMGGSMQRCVNAKESCLFNWSPRPFAENPKQRAKLHRRWRELIARH